MEWLDNLRDWNISRQLWWGHRIPAWYCPDGHVTVALEDPTRARRAARTTLEQDPDVLDTWFSSQLWPFSTLGLARRDRRISATFYPNAVLVTGYEILYLWVARMIMSGLSLMGDVPFRDGRDPRPGPRRARPQDVEVARQRDRPAGDDRSLRRRRAALLARAIGDRRAAGHPPVGESIEGARNFANKIWNAARLVFRAFPGGEPRLPPSERLTRDRAVAALAAPGVPRRGRRRARRVPVRGGRAGDLPIPLVGALRLGPRDAEGSARCWGGRP